MIPLVRTKSVFTSRWKALLWAIPIIWFAYTVGTSAPAPDVNSSNSETANGSDDNPGTVASGDNAAQKIPATWN